MGTIALLLAATAAGRGAPAVAQDTPANQTAESAQAAEPLTAPVVVDGVALFRVRGVTAYPAERRAADIAERIDALAADRSFPVESLVVRDTLDASVVFARGRRLFGVIDADAEPEGVARGLLAGVYRDRVAQAIERYRYERSSAVLWPNVGRALGATLGLAAGLWLWRRILRRLRGALARQYETGIRGVQIHTFEIMRGEQIRRALDRALGVLSAAGVVLACYLYLEYVLLLFPWTRALGHSFAAMLLRPLRTIGSGVLRYLPEFVFLLVLALVTRWVLLVSRLFFRSVASGAVTLPRFEPEWAQPTDRIVRVLVIAFAVVIAYPYIPGSGSEAFKGVTLLLGLIFSLGSPSVIGNLVAGQSLAFRRAFRVGDRVKIGEHIGFVTEIRLLTTYLRSPKNEQIVIPSSTIINSEVVNYSTLARSAGLILHTVVGIGYETPWRQVEAMLIEAANRTPGLLRQPPPFVLQKELGTFAVNYEINVYCDDTLAVARLYSALHQSILDVFNAYGVQIMTPAYEGDPERPKVVPREAWFTAPASPSGFDTAQRDGPRRRRTDGTRIQ